MMEDNKDMEINSLDLEDLNQVAGGSYTGPIKVNSLAEMEQQPRFEEVKVVLGKHKAKGDVLDDKLVHRIKSFAYSCSMIITLNISMEFCKKYWDQV